MDLKLVLKKLILNWFYFIPNFFPFILYLFTTCQLSSTTFHHHSQPQSTIICHQLLSTAADYHRQPVGHYLPLSVSIGHHHSSSLSVVTIRCCPCQPPPPATTIPLQPPSSITGIHHHLPWPASVDHHYLLPPARLVSLMIYLKRKRYKKRRKRKIYIKTNF